ncbi:hypothetical protein F2Q69_00060126 [Brassica cretica]|uniref:Uncharacterized protein n=1 Tax=Brassica cretica TaxID=69181 RepID=A0A8S9RIS8_BRACR|nr:hypothetical protein F2Q69_00060126 [Brassica cretica]
MDGVILRRFLQSSLSFLMIMEVAVNVTLLGQGVLIVNPQSKRYIAYLSRQFPPVMETFHSRFFAGVYRWFDFTRNESLISVKDLFILCDARYPRLQLTNEIDIQSRSVLLCFDERIWDPGILYSWRFDAYGRANNVWHQ